MSFTSFEFIIFFAAVILILLFIHSPFVAKRIDKDKTRKIKHIFLLIASYGFYAWWDWRFCFLVAFLTFVAYISAKAVYNNRYVSFFKVIGVAVPLIILGIFKYFNFFTESFCSLFSIENTSAINIILPLGISFYTFQSTSYTIDVIRKKIQPSELIDVALYVSFFPQLVSGPIVKASTFMPQLKDERKITAKGLEEGVQIFLFGMFKKIVLADRLSVFVDDIFAAPSVFSSFTVILAVIAYSLQIYLDFSGYSDMAIGCAKCMGFELCRNFNLPYISKNPTEFWKRWHISLSTWLQEYLYISLGGNRKGKIRTYFNLILTMILGGLWHGANRTFIVWGALHGFALCVHKIFRSALKIPKGKNSTGFVAAISVILNFCFVSLCWVFFRANSFSDAMAVLRKVFIWTDGVNQLYTWLFVALIFILVYTVYCYIMSIKQNGSDTKNTLSFNNKYIFLNLNSLGGLLIFFLAIIATVGLAYTGSNPFIYFQF